jgi:hypothetical protein
MAHGAVLLRSKLFTTEQLLAITTDHRNAGLPPREVAMLDVVEKIVLHAYKVTPEDIDGLRDNGFSDEEIVDIVLTAAARSSSAKRWTRSAPSPMTNSSPTRPSRNRPSSTADLTGLAGSPFTAS